MTAEAAATPDLGPLSIWIGWMFSAGLLTLTLGTLLAILGVNVAGALLPGIYVLDAALALLALSGILWAIRS